MFEADVRYINEVFEAPHILPEQLDALLADGWRHFGTQFFRYSYAFYGLDIRRVLPLRIRLLEFSLSKSQRRVLRHNEDVDVAIQPIEITDETIDLFERHKRRFKVGVPDSIYDFLSDNPSHVPCEGLEMSVRFEGKLIAVSYFDVTAAAVSAVYAMFDPESPSRSLGIFTMLKEIEFAREHGKQFYYQGYAYEGESFYDYKKRFRATEVYDWEGNWREFVAKEDSTADDADNTDRH